MGVGDAKLFFGFSSRGRVTLNTSVSTTRLPVAASKAIALNEMPRLLGVDSGASTELVTQTLPPPTTGDDHPRPSTGTFHRTFSSSLQWSGTSCASARPCPVGPRNCGHSCPDRVCAKSSSRSVDGLITRMLSRVGRLFRPEGRYG